MGIPFRVTTASDAVAELKRGRLARQRLFMLRNHGVRRRGRIEAVTSSSEHSRLHTVTTASDAVAELKPRALAWRGRKRSGVTTASDAVAELKLGGRLAGDLGFGGNHGVRRRG